MTKLLENSLLVSFDFPMKKAVLVICLLVLFNLSFATVYTHDQCHFGTATESSYFSASYVGENAFNDLINNYGWYTANGTTTGWLEYEFEQEKTIAAYSIFTRPLECSSAPKDWTFEAWDGTQWVVLDTQTGINTWTVSDQKTFEFSNTTSYTRYRISITANNGTTYTGIEEMEMYEEAVYIGNGGHESVWHFGFGASLDFRYDPPLAGTGSIIDQWEGCSSISDENGDILFYTDGEMVMDATNSVMSNGAGLYGSNSSTQSSLVVPHPTDSDIYYIFTLYRNGDYEFGHKGLCYSVVDMSLNGGLGDVVSGQKNIELNNPHTEKITAVNHANGTDIWVVTHDWGNNNFLAYLISSSGINTTPVTSSAGIVHYDSSNGWYSAGYMKVSPDGTKLALNVLGAHTTQLFDFDPATGIVSNPMTLTTSRTYAYGIEFSPDGTKLYTTGWEHNNILQYDISLGTEAAIAASEIEIAVSAVTGGSNYSGLGALQIAPDGNIYVAKDANGIGGSVNYLNSWLGIITDPDVVYTASKAGATYSDYGVYLGGNASGIGLPTYIQTYFKPLPVTLINFDAKCSDKGTVIEWSTASETNNDYFILEKSNGKDGFSEIARVKGAGNYNGLLNYRFVDKNEQYDYSYYRLKQVDCNGKSTLFNVVSLNCDEEIYFSPKLTAYPNPFDSEVKISVENITGEKLELQIYDEFGKLVFLKSYKLTNNTFNTTIQLKDLKSAVYNLRCISEDEILNTRLIRK